MDSIAKNLVQIRIEEEMKNSYLDYSMSVIIGRALPDVRDGLKPVHRRILYAMHKEGMGAGKRYSKCAGVVGEVLKKYHPHGDSAVYDAMVRMAQPWNLRYLLVDGQGNFGSVDGDPAAAYRYTECRMARLAEEMLVDIEKETVAFVPNFDGTTEEPEVMPCAFPNLLVNGADGIAVGMATKIPPHNLGEIVDAAIAVIENPAIDVRDLLRLVPGPDFPTAGTIYGRQGTADAYATGRGRIVVRGNAAFEDLPNGRRAIVIDEIPYQVNKARLIEQIADLVRDKKLEGIHALRDESDRRGMRIVVELKHDAFEEVVLAKLFKHTQLQSPFGVILLAIVDQRPKILTLKEMLEHYVRHRRDVTLRRTRFDLRKARERAHILEGYRIALDAIDAIIGTIRSSANAEIARAALVERFGLSEIQASAILDMRLQRLTGLERQKIEDEYAEILARIEELEAILASEKKLMGVVKDELRAIRAKYADPRRTRVVEESGEITWRDQLAEEDQVVTVSRLGYIKRCSPDVWRMQRRGGMGRSGMATREEDFVTQIFIANTHSILLVFTTSGRVYPLEVRVVPEAGRHARGRPIVNLVPIAKDEQVTSVVSVREINDQSTADLLFVSRKGIVKRTPLSEYRNIRAAGIIACGVAEGDSLAVVKLMEPGQDVNIMLFTARGQSVRFPRGEKKKDTPILDERSEKERAKGAPVLGRSARGNIGIRLKEDDWVVDALLVPAAKGKEEDEEDLADLEADDLEDISLDGDPGTEETEETRDLWPHTLLTVTEFGFGKRTPFDAWALKGRAGYGVKAHGLNNKTGSVVRAIDVHYEDQVMIVTDTGRIIRIPASEIRLTLARASIGVRLMRLDGKERIVDIARLLEPDESAPEEREAEAVEPDDGEDDPDETGLEMESEDEIE